MRKGNESLNIIHTTFTLKQILAVFLISTSNITVIIQQLQVCPLLHAQKRPLSINSLHSLTVYSATHLYQKNKPKNVLKYTQPAPLTTLAHNFPLSVSLSCSCCEWFNRCHIYIQRDVIFSVSTSGHFVDTQKQPSLSAAHFSSNNLTEGS